MTIPTEPGVPMPCGLYPECKDECTWPDCVQDEEKAAPNRATRRLKQFRPNRKERPPWTAADRTTPMPSSPRQR